MVVAFGRANFQLMGPAFPEEMWAFCSWMAESGYSGLPPERSPERFSKETGLWLQSIAFFRF
jgi:hypothetical protein